MRGLCSPIREPAIKPESLHLRQQKAEGAPRVNDALYRYIASHRPREVATDCQPESGSFIRAGERASHLNERLEDGLLLVFRNSSARIADRDEYCLACGTAADLDATAVS